MRPPPIRVRLTLWYLFVILLTLAVSSLAMYFGIQQAIEETVDTQLEVRSANLERFLKTGQGQQPAAGPAADDALYQITDASGAMLFQSPAMVELQVPLDVNQLQNHYRHHRDRGSFSTYYRRHGDVRVLASLVQAGGTQYRVQVATDVNPLYAVLETFRKWVWAMLPLILCLAGVGGYLLTGRAMRPVRDLVESTRAISELSLSRRIAVPAAQDELRELAATINAMLARLESAFNKVTRFTADASHELRTPVTVIRTTVEVLLERKRPEEQVEEMARLILREAEAMSTLIDELLTLARADAQTGSLELLPVDVHSLVEELNPRVQALSASGGLSWAIELPVQPLAVLGNGAQLRRLLLILIENACRYTQKGGSASLQVTLQEAEVVFTVTDTGIGIPPDDLIRVFERFYRASNARFYDAEGVGLGLAVAQSIAAAHGGTLSAESTVGSGTCMTLRLRKNCLRAVRPSVSARGPS